MGRRTFVYVDGFNLYFGTLKGTPYKWLDLSRPCARILSREDVVRIRYFTARVADTPNDPGKSARQDTYFRALQTIPFLQIHEGHYMQHPRWRPLAPSPPHGGGLSGQAEDGRRQYFQAPAGASSALITEKIEKGSDVNLATYLLLDAFRKQYEFAVIVSNDSDLTEPIRLLREEFDLPVGVFNPHAKSPSSSLKAVAVFRRQVYEHALKICQFDPVVTDSDGNAITKPSSW